MSPQDRASRPARECVSPSRSPPRPQAEVQSQALWGKGLGTIGLCPPPAPRAMLLAPPFLKLSSGQADRRLHQQLPFVPLRLCCDCPSTSGRISELLTLPVPLFRVSVHLSPWRWWRGLHLFFSVCFCLSILCLFICFSDRRLSPLIFCVSTDTLNLSSYLS